jgi:hypothetical protein
MSWCSQLMQRTVVSMRDLGNVWVVAVGYHDYLSENFTVRRWAAFGNLEDADEWASQFGEKPNGTYLVTRAEGHSTHMQGLVEDAQEALLKASSLERAKEMLYKAADNTSNAAALRRAARLLLGEDGEYFQKEDA